MNEWKMDVGFAVVQLILSKPPIISTTELARYCKLFHFISKDYLSFFGDKISLVTNGDKPTYVAIIRVVLVQSYSCRLWMSRRRMRSKEMSPV